MTCEFCSERLGADLKFCRHCGMLQACLLDEDEEIACENHRGVEAVGMCVVCGKIVCGDCAIKRQHRIFCENDEHVRFAQDWAVAYTTGTEYEAQMVRDNLEGAGMPCLVFSQRDHVYFLTIGNLAVVNVMVPKHLLGQARKLLRDTDLFFGENENLG